MKKLISITFVFLGLISSIHSQDDLWERAFNIPKFSIGYSLGTYIITHPSHIVTFEYSPKRKGIFKLDIGYIYDDYIYGENDSEVNDYGFRIMATYMKPFSTDPNILNGIGVTYRQLNLGNVGGVYDSNILKKMEEKYYLTTSFVGAYYQINKSHNISNRFILSYGGRIGLGRIIISRDKNVDPYFDKKSNGWGINLGGNTSTSSHT